MKVKLLDLLYLTIVHIFVLTCNIISINTYTTILIYDFLIISVFCTGRAGWSRSHVLVQMALQITKHTMIYHDSAPS
jgi:hypothetical protein